MRTTWNTPQHHAPWDATVRLLVTQSADAAATIEELEDALCDAVTHGAHDVVLEIEQPLDQLSSGTLDVIVRMAAFQLRRGDRLWLDMVHYTEPELRLMRVDRYPLELLQELRAAVRIAELEEAAVWS